MTTPTTAPATVGLRELNQRTSAVLTLVKDGASVVVTDRGQPIARIVPFTASPYEQLLAEGEYLHPQTDRLHAPPPAAPGAHSTGEVLDELRSERL